MDSDGEDDRPKRPRTAQEEIVQQALDEDDAMRRARKAQKEGVLPKQKTGKTLQEIEDEEGGPVKESLLGIAQAKRAAKRKKVEDVDDTDIPDDVDQFAEKLEVEEEGGIKFMPFSLTDEREIGHFDAEGNFIEDKVSKDDKDAWLESTEIVSDKVKEMIAQRQKQEEIEAQASARASAPLTDRQIATLKVELAGSMLSGETVTRAMKRVGGAGVASGGAVGAAAGSLHRTALGKREKLRLQQLQEAAGIKAAAAAAAGGGGAGGDAVDPKLIDRFTEITDRLFAEGETDVYTTTKEELERSAAMWLPKQQQQAATGPPPSRVGDAPGGQPAAGDEDDDMFAEEEEVRRQPAASGAPATASHASVSADGRPSGTPDVSAATIAAPGTGVASAGAGSVVARQPPPTTDFSSWPVRELVRFLKENGVDATGIVEKGDLVSRAAEVERQAAADAAAAGASSAVAPEGYVFDAASGYWHSAEAGMYYDTTSGSYFDGARWLRYVESSGTYEPL